MNTEPKDIKAENNSMETLKRNELEKKHTKKPDTSLEDILKTDDSTSEDIKITDATENQNNEVKKPNEDQEAKDEDTVASSHIGK